MENISFFQNYEDVVKATAYVSQSVSGSGIKRMKLLGIIELIVTLIFIVVVIIKKLYLNITTDVFILILLGFGIYCITFYSTSFKRMITKTVDKKFESFHYKTKKTVLNIYDETIDADTPEGVVKGSWSDIVEVCQFEDFILIRDGLVDFITVPKKELSEDVYASLCDKLLEICKNYEKPFINLESEKF